MMNDHEPPNRATVSATRSPSGQGLGDHLVRVAARPHAHEVLGGAELAADHGEHVEAGHRLALEQRRDVVAVDLDRRRRLDGTRVVWCGAVESIDESPKISPMAGRVDDDFLVVLVDHDDSTLPFSST